MGDAIDIGIGLIELAESIDVFVGDIPDRATGYEVEQVGLVDALGVGFLLDQTAFLLQAVPQPRVG